MAMALEGIKVIDVSQVAAAPMAARHLADFGADVVHIEHPVRGDSWRVFQAGQGTGTYGPQSEISYNWENYNRNKRSMTLDLSRDGARDIIYKMIDRADILTTNLRPFERERFGLEYDTVHRLNPKLIYGSLTGFGQKGPDKNNPSYDAVAYWARSGIPHRLRWQGAPLPYYTAAIGDNVAALALAYGIMTALYVREKTGIGQNVEISLFHTGIYQISTDISGALVTGKDCDEWKSSSLEDIVNPLSNMYETKDGRWLYLVILQADRWWSRVCKALDREDLEQDPRFNTFEVRKENHVTLNRIFANVFRSRTLEEWRPRLEGIPYSPYQNYIEVINDPQARANDIFVAIDHPAHGNMEVVASPIQLSETPASMRMPAPEMGQHTEEVLLEYGYTWAEIIAFKDQGLIA